MSTNYNDNININSSTNSGTNSSSYDKLVSEFNKLKESLNISAEAIPVDYQRQLNVFSGLLANYGVEQATNRTILNDLTTKASTLTKTTQVIAAQAGFSNLSNKVYNISTFIKPHIIGSPTDSTADVLTLGAMTKGFVDSVNIANTNTQDSYVNNYFGSYFTPVSENANILQPKQKTIVINNPSVLPQSVQNNLVSVNIDDTHQTGFVVYDPTLITPASMLINTSNINTTLKIGSAKSGDLLIQPSSTGETIMSFTLGQTPVSQGISTIHANLNSLS